MTENEFLLEDRKAKIQSVMRQYGEENFCISYSGGKDSTVLHYLVDMALPGNKIPRVYANTGIEYNEIVNFVKDLAEQDDRFFIIKPSVPIRQTLEEEGYPFKSKGHSEVLERYQNSGKVTSVKQYLGEREDKEPWPSQKSCPKILRYQFTPEFKMKISDKCCERLKEEPLRNWQKEHNKKYAIIGIMRDEGGRRSNAVCLAFKGKGNNKKLKAFQPLAPITKSWEEWFIEKYNIQLCKLYYEPFNFFRTGCKGCPFAVKLQKELEVLDKFFPNERKQCERIWKPVYEEYRRIGYRLRPLEWGRQTTIDEFLTESEIKGGDDW